MFKLLDDASNATDQARNGNEKGDEAKGVQQVELATPPFDIRLPDVHLNRVVNGQGPETNGAQNAQHRIKEWNHHGDNGGDDHISRAPDQAERIQLESALSWQPHIVLQVQKCVVGPSL